MLLQLSTPDENGEYAGNDEEINDNYNMFFEEEGEPVYERDIFQPVQQQNGYDDIIANLNSMTAEQRRVFEEVRSKLCNARSTDQLLLNVAGTAGTGN